MAVVSSESTAAMPSPTALCLDCSLGFVFAFVFVFLSKLLSASLVGSATVFPNQPLKNIRGKSLGGKNSLVLPRTAPHTDRRRFQLCSLLQYTLSLLTWCHVSRNPELRWEQQQSAPFLLIPPHQRTHPVGSKHQTARGEKSAD